MYINVPPAALSKRELLLLKKWQTSAVPEQLARQLQGYFPAANLYSAYEAGFSGFVLHRELESAGIKNLVVNAAGIETSVHNRVKTDKRDALKLASLLEAGRLRGIRVPSKKQEAQRLLTRTRQQLVEERTAVKNKIRMKCHQMGLIAADEQRQMGVGGFGCARRTFKPKKARGVLRLLVRVRGVAR